MTVNDVYERVAEVVAPDRKLFFIFLNDCIADLAAAYGERAVYYPNEPPEDKTLSQGDSELKINEIYHAAVADYVIYRMGGGDVYMQEYQRKADAAYHTQYLKRSRRLKGVVSRCQW